MNLNWIKSIWSEPDGSGSSTRIHITALIAFTIGVGVTFGLATHQKKFSIEQFNSFLGSAGTFITTTCGPLYAANKLADWANNKNNKS